MNSNQLEISRQVAINSTILFKGCKSENMTENQQIVIELNQVKSTKSKVSRNLSNLPSRIHRAQLRRTRRAVIKENQLSSARQEK